MKYRLYYKKVLQSPLTENLSQNWICFKINYANVDMDITIFLPLCLESFKMKHASKSKLQCLCSHFISRLGRKNVKITKLKYIHNVQHTENPWYSIKRYISNCAGRHLAIQEQASKHSYRIYYNARPATLEVWTNANFV